MSDTVYRVITRYEADTAGAEQKVGTMASRIGSTIANAAGGVASIFDRAVVAVGRMAAAAAVAAGVAGVGALYHGVVQLNAQAEETGIAIAGMLNAGGATRNFEAAMRLSDSLILRMREHARDLPGEFEDLQNLFQGGLMGGLNAGKSTTEIEALSSRMMAVTQALRIDSQQAGRDFAMMLEGRAGAQVATFTRLRGQIGLTAEQFNALSASERFDRISRALNGFDPMIRRFGSSWAAVSSTFKDTLTTFLRTATAPLFDRARDGLSSVNDWLEHNRDKVQRIASIISDRLVRGFDTLVERGRQLYDFLRNLSLQHVLDQVQRIGGGMLTARAGLGLMSSPGVLGAVGGLAGGGALAGAGMLAAIFAPIAVAASTGSVNLTDTFHHILQVTSPLVSRFGDLFHSMQPLLSLIGTGLVGVFTTLIEAITPLVSAIAQVTTGLFNLLNSAGSWIMAHLPHVAGEGAAPGVETNEQRRVRLRREAIEAVPDITAAQLAQIVSGSGRGEHFSVMSPVAFQRNALTDILGANGDGIDLTAAARRRSVGGLVDMMAPFLAAPHEDDEVRGRRQNAALAGRGNTHVTIRLEQHINDASDPDRVVTDTRALIGEAWRRVIESTDQPSHAHR